MVGNSPAEARRASNRAWLRGGCGRHTCILQGRRWLRPRGPNGSRLSASRSGFAHADQLSFFQGIGGVDDDAVFDGDAAKNLQRGSVVAADGNWSQLNLAVGADHSYARAFLAEEHGIYRNGELGGVDGGLEMQLAERAGEQASVGIGNV